MQKLFDLLPSTPATRDLEARAKCFDLLPEIMTSPSDELFELFPANLRRALDYTIDLREHCRAHGVDFEAHVAAELRPMIEAFSNAVAAHEGDTGTDDDDGGAVGVGIGL